MSCAALLLPSLDVLCAPHHMHGCMQGGNFCSSVGPHSHLQPAAQCGRVLDPASEGLQRDHLPHGARGALATGTTEGGTCGEGMGWEWRGRREGKGEEEREEMQKGQLKERECRRVEVGGGGKLERSGCQLVCSHRCFQLMQSHHCCSFHSPPPSPPPHSPSSSVMQQ